MTLKYRHRERSKLSLICGLIGLMGCCAAIVTDIIGSIVVYKHNPISETISSLAIGKAAWIQDTGLNLFAAGLIACAIALYIWRLGKTKWKAGTVLLALLGIDILLISEHNKYAGRPDVAGAAIHIYCVYALGILFTLTPFLLSFGLRKISKKWYRLSLGTAITWGILSPIFFFIPTSWDGAYERFLSLIMIGWVAAISLLLFWRGIGNFEIKINH